MPSTNAGTVTSRTAGLRDAYDREASQYDARRYDSAEGRLFSELEVKILRSWLPLRTGVRVLDVPAGTGRLTLALAQTGATIVGADLSANMLSVAASKCREAGLSKAHVTQGDGSRLPFADNTFDAVVSFKFFHLVPNDRKRAFIQEMARVVKPGQPVIVEFNSPFYGIFLAGIRYYFFKKRPGGMRKKCLFPDQVGPLFEGLDVTRTIGVKLPMSAAIASILGRERTDRLNLWIGNLPGLRYVTYALIIEARKPAERSARS